MINWNIYQSFILLTFIVYVKFFWSCKLIFQRFFSNSCRSYDSNLKLLPLTDAFQRRCCSGGKWIRPLTCCNTICTASPDFVPAVFESVSSKTKRPDSFQVRYMDDCLDNRRTRQAISSVLSNNKWSWPFNAKRWGSLYRLQFLEQILFILNVSQLVHVWKHCVQHNLQESCECISYVYLSWNYIYPQLKSWVIRCWLWYRLLLAISLPKCAKVILLLVISKTLVADKTLIVNLDIKQYWNIK